MAAIDFPNSPTTGQLFTVGDITWEWTGSVWQGIGTPVPGPEGPAGADGAPGADGADGAPGADGAENAVPLVNGAVTTASTSSTVVRNITLSTSTPSGGMDGDVWLQYTA